MSGDVAEMKLLIGEELGLVVLLAVVGVVRGLGGVDVTAAVEAVMVVVVMEGFRKT